MVFKKSFVEALVLGLGLTASAFAGGKPASYHLLQKISVSGDMGWDYSFVDPDSRRLYVSHGNKVDVLDAGSGALLGSVEGLQGVHGIAVVTARGKGFITDSKAQGVWIFDTSSLKTVGFVATAKDPDGILYDPAGKRVFVFCGDGQCATVLRDDGSKVVAVLPLGGAPESSCSDGRGHVFVNLKDKNLLLKIDSRALKVTARWPIAPGDVPVSLSMDIEHQRLFSGCHNKKLVVVDAGNGKVVADLPIGGRVDAGSFDPASGDIFNSCGDGTLSVIHEDAPDKYSVVENVPTQVGSRTHALDRETHRLFLSSALFGPTPPPTSGKPHPRPALLPGTFAVLVFGR